MENTIVLTDAVAAAASRLGAIAARSHDADYVAAYQAGLDDLLACLNITASLGCSDWTVTEPAHDLLDSSCNFAYNSVKGT